MLRFLRLNHEKNGALPRCAYPAAMLEVPADMLGWMLGACFAGVLAVAAGALGLYLIARAEGRGILTVGPP